MDRKAKLKSALKTWRSLQTQYCVRVIRRKLNDRDFHAAIKFTDRYYESGLFTGQARAALADHIANLMLLDPGYTWS